MKLNPNDIDLICEMVLDGKTWQQIADHFKTPKSTLYDFVSKNPEFSAREKLARQLSADTYAEEAKSLLLACPADRDEVARLREIAQHWRWMASKRNPKNYGDKMDVTTQGDKITTPTILNFGGTIPNTEAAAGAPDQPE